MRKTPSILFHPFLLLLLTAILLLGRAEGAQPWTNIQDYFPPNWREQKTDLKPYIEKALKETAMLYFPGSADPEAPEIYHFTAGVVIPARTRVYCGANSQLKRLPSTGRFLTLRDGVHLKGAVINGNKYAHWPEFQELGKENGSAIAMGSYCVLEDCVVYDNPGTAFSSRRHYNKLYRCLAENIGYIDVKFGATFYSARHDQWSGDGFYFRGTGNLIKDSEAYDCQRWDFCSSHRGAMQNSYVDCRGGDLHFRTYGFIDVEDSDANNRLIRCISPNSHIAIPISAGTEVIQCMATRITAWDREESIDLYKKQASDGIRLDGNITTNGGIVIGGWSSRRQQLVPGATSPMVTNNRMYKMHGGPSDGYSDYSFSVHSINGAGIVSNNILFEFGNGLTKGPGIKLENIEGANNQVVYGEWKLQLPEIQLTYGKIDRKHQVRRQQEIGAETLPGLLEGRQLAADAIYWIQNPAKVVPDPLGTGGNNGWEKTQPEGSEATPVPLGLHWGAVWPQYRGVAWYYVPLPETQPQARGGNWAVYFGGIDSSAKIYLNGDLLAEHPAANWSKPSLHRLPDRALGGKGDLLVLRVESHSGVGGLYGPVALVRLP